MQVHERKNCFVVMPFSSRTRAPGDLVPWTELYIDHIKPTVEEVGLTCFRADEIVRPGSIIADVVRAIAESFVVVAEMTGQNANVFYELGVRHALSRRTILISQTTDDIPFDLRDARTITYSFTPRGAKELEAKLRAAIAEIIAVPNHCDNPVQSYLSSQGQRSADMTNVSQHLHLASQLAELQKRYDSLSAAVDQVKSALRPSGAQSHVSDLFGTWHDEYGYERSESYLFQHGNLLVITYAGRWPGCGWGRFDGQIYRYAWSRFDKSLDGEGILRLQDPGTLRGGIWFGRRKDSEEQPLEKHVLTRLSLEISPAAQPLVERATKFVTSVAA